MANEKNYDILSDINNLVHPYNSYQKLTVVMNNYGKTHWRNQCENYKKTHPDADGYRSGSGYAEYIRHGSV